MYVKNRDEDGSYDWNSNKRFKAMADLKHPAKSVAISAN